MVAHLPGQPPTMKFPFTTEEFLDVFKQYNQDVWPAQIAFVLLALLCVYFIIGHKTYKTRIVTSILAFFWLWMGLVYHLLFFATINPAAYLFAGLFMVQGILFFILGVLREPLSISHPTINIWAGFVLIAYALLIYPIIGYYAGHGYPFSPTFGLPCPTTIFTFGIILLTGQKWPISLMIIPLAWSILSLSAALYLGMYEDIGLFLAAGIWTGLSVQWTRQDRWSMVNGEGVNSQ